MQKYAFLCFALLLLASCSNAVHPAPDKDILTISRDAGFDLAPVPEREKNFLVTVLPAGGTLRSIVLLQEKDRVAAVFWYEDAHADQQMNRLTEQLFDQFSSGMHSLVDDVITEPNHQPIDVLAFTDPVMSEERFLFARIGNTLCEFHIADENENLVQGILLELAKTENTD